MIYRILFSLLVLVSTCAFAQNTWEEPKQVEPQKGIDAKYAAGVIPMSDGKVVFEKTLNVKGKTKEQIYSIIKTYLEDLTKEPNQILTQEDLMGNRQPKSRIVIDKPEKGELVGSYDEWLVFRKAALMLDRTEMKFCIIANCSNEKVYISITRIYYIYEKGERSEIKAPAEEIITDENALNKKKTKLAHIFGKFRIKTIDRVNYIFKTIEEALK